MGDLFVVIFGILADLCIMHRFSHFGSSTKCIAPRARRAVRQLEADVAAQSAITATGRKRSNAVSPLLVELSC